METIIIVFVTLIFGFILFNVINNKKISLISFLLLLLICGFYFTKLKFNDKFNEIFSFIKNENAFMLMFCGGVLIFSFVEYYVGMKSNTKEVVKEIIVNEEKKDEEEKEQIDLLVVNLELFEEPLACLVHDCFIINNKMKKLLKIDNYIIEKKKLFSLVYSQDKNSFLNTEGHNNFRLNINNEFQWFESNVTVINEKKYCLIKKCDTNKESTKNKLKSFKELVNVLNLYEEKLKDYYLIFFNINNYNDIVSFYGNDFSNLVVNKHLSDINLLSYVSNENFYYISKNEYVLLLDNNLEYNILLSELENNSSILIKNDIIISDNKIIVKGKVGAIASCNVKNKNASNIINKGFEMVKLASEEDFQLDYAIFHEIDEEIDYSLKDLNIDLNFDFTKYKQRIQ